jgi:predicted CxxxxCH...CXXCH cytochrome family protein
MTRLISLALLAGAVSAAGLGLAQQATPKVNNVPIQQTPVWSGEQMFSTYCAVCHGVKGTGNGPAARSLKVAPPDLTALKQKNGGVFPANHVAAVLQSGVENPAHGSAEMPIWGNLMLTLHSGSPDAPLMVHQRITNLTDYLKMIQK